MNSRDDQRLRARIQRMKRQGLIDEREEEEDRIVLYLGSLSYGVRRNRIEKFLNGLTALRRRLWKYLSKGQPDNNEDETRCALGNRGEQRTLP